MQLFSSENEKFQLHMIPLMNARNIMLNKKTISNSTYTMVPFLL